jgi:threonine dehydrogenase-like Zn-dependent dehydrogenase
MSAAFLVAPRKYEVRQVPIPAIGPEDMLLHVEACGVCTSDSYHWFGSKNPYPFAAGAPGHETCGIVEAVGDGVTGFKPGQRVVAITFPGFGYAQYVRAEARYATLLDESFGDQIVLGEPLACAVNAMRRSGARPGDSVLVLGVGYMGALALQILRLMGAAPLIAADIRPNSRALAARLGADVVLDSGAADFNEQVLALTDGRGADVVVEATGVQSGLDAATQAIRIKGTMVIFGYHVGALRMVDMRLWNWKGIDIVNGHERDSVVYTEGMRYGLKLLKYKKITNDLISHSFPLAEIEQAFALFETRPENYVKSVIRPNQ